MITDYMNIYFIYIKNHLGNTKIVNYKIVIILPINK